MIENSPTVRDKHSIIMNVETPQVMIRANSDQLKQVFWMGTERWDELLAERAAASGALSLSQFTRDAIAQFERK